MAAAHGFHDYYVEYNFTNNHNGIVSTVPLLQQNNVCCTHMYISVRLLYSPVYQRVVAILTCISACGCCSRLCISVWLLCSPVYQCVVAMLCRGDHDAGHIVAASRPDLERGRVLAWLQV